MSNWYFVILIQIVLNLLVNGYLKREKQRQQWMSFALFAFPFFLILWTFMPLIRDVFQTENIAIGIVWNSLMVLKFLVPIGIQLVFNRLLFDRPA